jgi:hypothetical protein
VGGITPNRRAVSIVADELSVTLQFLLDADSADDREVIEDIQFEFQALQADWKRPRIPYSAAWILAAEGTPMRRITDLAITPPSLKIRRVY